QLKFKIFRKISFLGILFAHPLVADVFPNLCRDMGANSDAPISKFACSGGDGARVRNGARREGALFWKTKEVI
ncbi:MAG: hypothetical protein M0018_11460, partial [Nitrospiraceae bacterium]|nr:hypothetical protein [Nitrospiraceae bacterium]